MLGGRCLWEAARVQLEINIFLPGMGFQESPLEYDAVVRGNTFSTMLSLAGEGKEPHRGKAIQSV